MILSDSNYETNMLIRISFRILTGNRILLKVTDFKKFKNKIELLETKNLNWINLTIDSTKLKGKLRNWKIG